MLSKFSCKICSWLGFVIIEDTVFDFVCWLITGLAGCLGEAIGVLTAELLLDPIAGL